MSLRFYVGGSGCGKSHQLYTDIIARSMREPQRNFLIIVPDQFTMQTQLELVKRHPRGGIMNIDVLSFGRLSHRIFEEVGGNDAPVLDDTGKSLVLRKVAGNLADKLPVLGGNLKKIGYIHEVKSAISEFMQYGISPSKLQELVVFSEKRGALHYKLKDLECLYAGFCEYIKEKYITTEEALDRLRNVLCKSEIIRDSVVVFDGFTGFTPVQNYVIQELMQLCSEVIVTLIIGRDVLPVEGISLEDNANSFDNEQQLFYLSHKTICDLSRLAKEAGVCRGKDIIFTDEPVRRYAHNESLAHLERELFRFPGKAFTKEQNTITLFEAANPKEEVYRTCAAIRRLVREEGCYYRDIAVVTGDMSAYAAYMEEACTRFAIPYYLDTTRGIVLSPFVEYIRSALQTVIQRFSYETVFHFIRSGLVDMTAEEADRLENYVLALGIRGKKRWTTLFSIRSREMDEDSAVEKLAALNASREKVVTLLAPLMEKHKTAGELVMALYQFIESNHVQEKLKQYEAMFEKAGDMARAKEYSQIYRLIMELLEQIYALLGDEEMSLEEFLDILDAGFGEIEVGTIPQNVDRVLIGDIERTRLKEVKALFFLGINDGSIPKGATKGGIISDIDREFLAASEIELAPTPRQQMYIQRLYLYMNMTKPTDRLYLSYANMSGAGRSMRPAYLIDTMQKLFPAMQKLTQAELMPIDRLELADVGMEYFARELRAYADGQLRENKSLFFTLYDTYAGREEYRDRLNRLLDAAFYTYEKSSLGRTIAKALYGQILENSVSRLEQYAACAYAHFLRYGLSLEERETFTFEDVDMGMIFHGVLEEFSGRLAERGLQWFDFPKETGEEIIAEAIETYAATYKDTLLFDSARNEYAMTRMKRILNRAVQTLQYQLKEGAFSPKKFEVSFSAIADLDSVSVTLSEDEKMKLRGRIDRIDTNESADSVYVKVIDYKSGNHTFDLAALYYGLQLQLVIYLNAAAELEKREHPDKRIVPAGILYYHVADPYVKIDGADYAAMPALTEEDINQRIRKELRMTGVVNSDHNIIRMFDQNFIDKSDIIPIGYKKDGSLLKSSEAYSGEELACMQAYVSDKVKALGREIMDGNIELNPYEMGDRQACTYCAYRSVCGFDSHIPGYEKRQLEDVSAEDIFMQMKKEQ